MKNILITGGPTREPIDEVMKITTFSTGSLSLNLTKHFLDNGYGVTLIANETVHTKDIEKEPSLTLKKVETTVEMMDLMEEYSKKKKYDALLHTAAVGDYESEFTFLLEDLAEELHKAYEAGDIKSAADLLQIMENPQCKLDDSSKISSYQKNLTVKLTLTPKIIARLREWYPHTLLIGCKLLDNVSEEELIDVARALCEKNKADYILANDLAELGKGNSARLLVNTKGFTGTKLENSRQIFNFVDNKLR